MPCCPLRSSSAWRCFDAVLPACPSARLSFPPRLAVPVLLRALSSAGLRLVRTVVSFKRDFLVSFGCFPLRGCFLCVLWLAGRYPGGASGATLAVSIPRYCAGWPLPPSLRQVDFVLRPAAVLGRSLQVSSLGIVLLFTSLGILLLCHSFAGLLGSLRRSLLCLRLASRWHHAWAGITLVGREDALCCLELFRTQCVSILREDILAAGKTRHSGKAFSILHSRRVPCRHSRAGKALSPGSCRLVPA